MGEPLADFWSSVAYSIHRSGSGATFSAVEGGRSWLQCAGLGESAGDFPKNERSMVSRGDFCGSRSLDFAAMGLWYGMYSPRFRNEDYSFGRIFSCFPQIVW